MVFLCVKRCYLSIRIAAICDVVHMPQLVPVGLGEASPRLRWRDRDMLLLINWSPCFFLNSATTDAETLKKACRTCCLPRMRAFCLQMTLTRSSLDLFCFALTTCPTSRAQVRKILYQTELDRSPSTSRYTASTVSPRRKRSFPNTSANLFGCGATLFSRLNISIFTR